MGTPSRQVADPEWKQLLRLGEQLIQKPTPTEQCELIVAMVGELMSAKTQVWLADPAYQLFSGRNNHLPLFMAEAPALAQKSAQERALVTAASQQPGSRARSRPTSVAVPLIANDNLLGVLQAERTEGPAFSARDLTRLEGLVAHAAIAMEITRQENLKNWRLEQLSLVRSVSAKIANLRDPRVLYDQVTRLILETFHHYFVAIFTVVDKRHCLCFKGSAAQSGRDPFEPDFTVEIGEGIIGTVAESGKELLAPDVRKEQHYRYIDSLPETLSEVALPLKVEDRLLGVLDVQSDRAGAFHEIDMLVLRALADTIALAIESAHLYDDLHRRAEQISSVFEVSHALTSILDMDELLNEVVTLIQKRFGYPFVHLYTVHPGRRKIIYEAGSGERSAAMRSQNLSYPLDADKGLLAWAARNGRTFLANDVTQEPLYLPSDVPPYDTRAELTIPLMVGTEVIGLLDIQSKEANAFDQNDISLFEALAASVAIAVRNANLYRSEQWRRRVAESFRDVAHLITTNQPLDAMMDTILDRLENNLPCDASAIWLVEEDPADPEKHRLKLSATRHIAPDRILQAILEHPEEQAMLERALESDQPLIRRVEEPLGPLGAAMGFEPNYSSIAAPMRTGRRPLGILTLAHAQDGRYGSEAQAITATFASYAAVAIENGRLYRESQEQALVSTMLLQVAEASQSILTGEDLLQTMVRLTRLLMGVRKCAFLIWEEAVQGYEMKAWYGFDPQPAEDGRARLYSSALPALSRLDEEKTTILIENPLDDLDMPEISLAPEPGLLVALPLMVRGETVGAFLVAIQVLAEGGKEEVFDPKSLSILQGIAHQTAITLDNLRLLEARQEEAYVTAALLQVAQAVVSSTDLHDTLDTIVHLLPILVGIDTCIIYLWDPSSRLFRPIQAYGDSRRDEELMLSTSYAPGEHHLLDSVLKEGVLHLCEVIVENTPFKDWPTLECKAYAEVEEQAATSYGNWLLAYPLSMQNMVLGVMLVQEKNTSPTFWERRMEIINGIAQQVSLAIQNDIVKQEMVENERIEREITLARQIQETFLPTSLPRLEGWEMDLRWETAREVGGDFYDVFRLDGNRLGLVIADVSDKGLPAALYMTVTRTLIHAYAAPGDKPAQVLEAVNGLLVNDSPESMFITVVYAILSLDSGELTYANAGHNLPLLYRTDPKAVEQLPKGGTALGVLNDLQLENHTLQITDGDTLILFTDGVVDILSPENESFGEDRLRQVIAQYGEEGVDSLLEQLDDALVDFRKGARQFDDVTLVAVRRDPPGKKTRSGAE